MKKLIYATAFGIGYVLGTRAGRERYEQIRQAAEKVQTDPRVQDAVRKAEGMAQDAVTLAQDDERLADLAHSVKDSAQKVREQAVGVVSSVRQSVEDDDVVGDVVDTAKGAAKDVADSAKAAADGGGVKDVVDTAKHAAKDVGESVKDAADDGAIEDAVGTAKDAAGDAKKVAEESASEATRKIKAASDEARGESGGADADGETWPPHPDEHIAEPEDEVVFTTGPDDKS